MKNIEKENADLIKKLTEFQEQLAPNIWIPTNAEPIYQNAILATSDVQYKGEFGFGALVISDLEGNIFHTFTQKYEAMVPYIPSFFAFREGSILIELIKEAEQELDLNVDILLIDGHGVAHPRRFGLASYVGLALGKMAIGVAKDTLLKYEGNLLETQGSTLEIMLGDKTVGYAYRSRNGVKPIFVSAGHKTSHLQALEVAKKLTREYRQLDVLREADRLARETAKAEIDTL